MRVGRLVVATAATVVLLATPAMAAFHTESGVGRITDPGGTSSYSLGDPVTYSFTYDDTTPLIGAPFLAFFLTAFSLNVDGQSFALSDNIGIFGVPPFAFSRGAGAPRKVFFGGVNGANTALFSGIELLGAPANKFEISEPNGSGNYALGVLNVPEPASWALFITGFGLTGAALRRRQALATA